MTYTTVYDNIQALSGKVSRKVILKEIQAVAQLEYPVRIMDYGFDIRKCRGLYLGVPQTKTMFPNWEPCHTVVRARDLNECWKRLVTTKELIHLLDGEAEFIRDSQVFEKVVSEIWMTTGEKCEQTHSEYKALWKALGLLCPEHLRAQLKAKWTSVSTADRQSANLLIANQLKIPLMYVPALFSGRYEEEIKEALGRSTL